MSWFIHHTARKLVLDSTILNIYYSKKCNSLLNQWFILFLFHCSVNHSTIGRTFNNLNAETINEHKFSRTSCNSIEINLHSTRKSFQQKLSTDSTLKQNNLFTHYLFERILPATDTQVASLSNGEVSERQLFSYYRFIVSCIYYII